MVHVQLLNAAEETIVSGTEATDALGTGETWHWRVKFEDTNPSSLLGTNDSSNDTDGSTNASVSYQVWATGTAR